MEPSSTNPWEAGERQPEHRRNAELEAALGLLNTYLQNARGQLDRPERPVKPVVFIVGCARAGSTILFQSLAASGVFAYPSNIMSRFYRDPYVGALIHRILHDLDDRREIFTDQEHALRFESLLGKSKGAASPHEFWYFWRSYFKFGAVQSELLHAPDARERHALISDIAGIEEVFGKPVLMKAMELNWHIPLLRELFPNSVFLFNHRDMLNNAISLLKARIIHGGSEKGWYSYKPEEYAMISELPPWEQVVAQVWFTERAVRRGLEGIPTEDVQEVAYADLCRDPMGVHERIRQRVGRIGKYEGPKSFTISGSPVPEELRVRAEVILSHLPQIRV
jgi:LPS sulfotransferase NodH